jgi:hypothetical protein
MISSSNNHKLFRGPAKDKPFGINDNVPVQGGIERGSVPGLLAMFF